MASPRDLLCARRDQEAWDAAGAKNRAFRRRETLLAFRDAGEPVPERSILAAGTASYEADQAGERISFLSWRTRKRLNRPWASLT